MQKILHIKLKSINHTLVELHRYYDSFRDSQKQALNTGPIEDLLGAAGNVDWSLVSSELRHCGCRLYQWLNGSDRFLERAIDAGLPADLIGLAIETEGLFSHLPWELLHDGSTFLAQRRTPLLVPLRWRDQVREKTVEKRRSLQVRFMAAAPMTSPPAEEVELQEQLILDLAARHGLNLTLAEGGTLKALTHRSDEPASGDFELFHLCGPVAWTADGGCLVTESDMGEAQPAEAADIAAAIGPKANMVFLSGTSAGEADHQGTVHSLCQALLEQGVETVAGWCQKYPDRHFGRASASFYSAISEGQSIIGAIAGARQILMAEGDEMWHQLRLYLAAGGADDALLLRTGSTGAVAPLGGGIQTRFLDQQQQVRVCAQAAFVGRRRTMQRSLQALRHADKIGVILHGMGGLGKSSLAARLCDQLKESHQAVVLVGKIDGTCLVNRICAGNDSSGQHRALSFETDLRSQLKQLFGHFDRPRLIVWDHFDPNCDPAGDEVMLPDAPPEICRQAREILDALVFSIDSHSHLAHRIIITSRWPLSTEAARRFYVEQLDRLAHVDVAKLLYRLRQGQANGNDRHHALSAPAIDISDGNPRLLERLFGLFDQPDLDHQLILDQMAAQKEPSLREMALLQALIHQQEPDLCRLLGAMLVFTIAVPVKAVAAVSGQMDDLETLLNRARRLGLLEHTLSQEDLYRVPRRLTPVLKGYLPENRLEICRSACKILHDLWGLGAEPHLEERLIEIHRLALMAEDPHVAVDMVKLLLSAWSRQSRYLESEQLCVHTLEIVEKVLGSDHPDTALVLNHLGTARWHGATHTGGRTGQLLTEAADAYRRALRGYTREQHPSQWAATQNNLGNALTDQAARTAGRANTRLLAEAVAAYRAALSVYTSEQHPSQWADAQNNLGNALSDQAAGTAGIAGTGLLDEAVVAYRATLSVHTRERYPSQWAATQNNLGTVLADQAARTDDHTGIGLLGEAADAFRAALSIYTWEQHPTDWAATQNNLGNVLWNQAMGREDQTGVALLDEAVDAFRYALRVYTRENLPQQWATTQNNLGSALSDLGIRTGDQAGGRLLAEAVDAFRAALEIYRRDQSPQDWAMAHNNLGTALWNQSLYTGGQAGVTLLGEAVDAFRHALTVYTREHLPQDWAMTQNNLGNALCDQAACSGCKQGSKLLAEAVNAYESALEIFKAAEMGWHMEAVQDNIDKAMDALRRCYKRC